MASENLIPVFMPALSALLINAEDAKGSPLTVSEVLSIRGKAPCIMMEAADAEKLNESRGYRDIDPKNCWYDWQLLRNSLGRKPALDPGARVNQVKTDSPEYTRAVNAAKASLAHFRALLVQKKSGARYMIKTRVVDSGESAYMWLGFPTDSGEGFEGKFFEVPKNFKEYKAGDALSVPDAAVVDWMVIDNGRVHGGFTIRVVRDSKPESEHAEYDRFMGVTSYAPLPE